ISSYGIFARRKRDGQIPPRCRFQVSLPTPLAPIAAFVAPEDQAGVEPLYEERMIHELAAIFERIPHDQLTIQWDTNFEFAMLDEVMPVWFGDPRSGIVERLGPLRPRHAPRRGGAWAPTSPTPTTRPPAIAPTTRSRSSTWPMPFPSASADRSTGCI